MTQRRGPSRGGAGRAGRRAASEPLDLFLDPEYALASAAAQESALEPEPRAPVNEYAPGERPESAIAIATLTQTARDVLEGAFVPLWVRGEVTDFKAHRNGHWYFCLRDETAQVRCVMWARDRVRVPAAPDDGMQVVAFGQLTVYPARGEMQLTVRAIEAAGDGLWRKAMLETVARLEREGLLAPERKRALPRYPRRVAVVTSPSGAALRDVIAVARRRSPAVEIVVVPAKVQGEGAPEEICAALERVARWRDCDVVIVGRGGGGREDLWAFNDERVARALAGCPVPTISAVGHEVDVTVCDLVADHRAATPSAAAEAAVPLRSQMADALRRAAARLDGAMRERLFLARERAHALGERAGALAQRHTERRRARMEALAGRLNALSPLATLSRGYAVARDGSGATLASAARFAPDVPFELLLRDGVVDAVTRVVRPGAGPRRASEEER